MPASMILSLTLLAAMIQGATDGCCEMKAVTSIGGGRQAEIKVTITDLSDSPVSLFVSSPQWDLTFDLKDAAGRSPNLTAYGKSMLEGERRGSRILKHLSKGESLSQSVDLQRIYQLQRGEYWILISRAVLVAGVRTTLQTRTTVDIP